MKRIAMLLFILSVMAVVNSLAEPGWYSRKAVPVEPGQVVIPVDTPRTPRSGDPSEASDEIKELARGLQYDPELIYEFVLNHIDYVPYWGLLKGATRTLLDRSGNDMDQSALLAKLLEESGYQTRYIYGTALMPIDTPDDYDMANWLGVSPDVDLIAEIMWKGGIGFGIVNEYVVMDRIVVDVYMDGQWMRLDPAYKKYAAHAGSDIMQASGYSRSDLLAWAGGTGTTDYVQNLDRTNVASYLSDRMAQLDGWVQSNRPHAEVAEVFGGRQIVAEEIKSFPPNPKWMLIEYSNFEIIPTNMIHTVRIQHGAMDETFNIADLANAKLALTYEYDGSGGGEAVNAEKMENTGPQPVYRDTPVTNTLTCRPTPDLKPPVIINVEKTDGDIETSSTYLGEIDFGRVPASSPNPNTMTWSPCNDNGSHDKIFKHWYENNSHGCFSVHPSEVWVDPGDCTTIYYYFYGNNRARGQKTAVLQRKFYYQGDINYHQYYYDVKGFVAADLEIEPYHGYYGWGYLNESEVYTVRLKNKGNYTLSGTITSIGGDDPSKFNLTSHSLPLTFSIGPELTMDLDVRYSRSSYGEHFGTLRMTFNYDGISYGESDVIGLWGDTVHEPSVSRPGSVDFGAHYYEEPVSTTIGYQNSGSYPFSFNSIGLSGSDATRYRILSGAGSGTLYGGQTRNIEIEYKADARGMHDDARINIEFVCDGITYTDSISLYGETVSRPRARLWLDDALIAEESFPTAGSNALMTVSVDHPYSSVTESYDDQTVDYTLKRGGNYVVLCGFGEYRSDRLLKQRQRILEAYREQGLDNLSREVLTESLHIMGQTWMYETALTDGLINEMNDVLSVTHHRFGIMAQEEGYYVDVKAQVGSSSSRSGSTNKWETAFRAGGLFMSALEHGVLEQMQGADKPASSTVRLLRMANDEGQKIYHIRSNNYSAVVSQLQNYSVDTLNDFQSRVNLGQTLVVHRDAHVAMGEWRGHGYIATGPDADHYAQISMKIDGDYHGGYAAYPGYVQSDNVYNNSVPLMKEPVEVQHPESNEPVDLATGAYLYEHTDLSMGQDEPLGLKFMRFYTSENRNQESVMGCGWTHNYNIYITEHVDYNAGLGLRATRDALVAALASGVASDLVQHEENAKGWMLASLVSEWGVDRLVKNAVSVHLGSKVLTWVARPDGSFVPPPGVDMELTRDAGLYRLEKRNGTVIEFNASDKIDTWTDVDGNRIDFLYDGSDRLISAQSSTGRELTLIYSGDLLDTVSDSAGRVTEYQYDGDDNLTGYADPENNAWSYAYDGGHRLVSITDPLGQTTISNIYDTLGRVMRQISATGQPYDFYYSDYRNVEEDPKDGEDIYYFDDYTRQTGKEEPPMGRDYVTYDGQNHVVQRIDPRGYETVFQYDGDHHMTNVIDALSNRTAYVYNGSHDLIEVRTALGHVTQFEYDTKHHKTLERDALGNESMFTYYPNGLLHTATDPEGHLVTYTYDAFGHPDTVTRTDGGTVEFDYNSRGDMTARTDANGHTSTYQYDARRLLLAEINPLGHVTSNAYNAAEQLVSETDAEGHTVKYTYTPAYKVETITYPDGGVVSNRYDSRDLVVAVADALGNIASNEHDAAGRVVKTVDPMGAETVMTYDSNGNVLTVTDPLGHTVSNVYDALNRVVAVTDPLGHTEHYEYDVLGRKTKHVAKHGLYTRFHYDALGRLTNNVRPDGESESYEFDDVGNMTAFVNAQGERLTFTYDGMNRTLTETDPLGHTKAWTYDSAGNIRTRTDARGWETEYAYDSANRLTNTTYFSGGNPASGIDYHFDGNGNLTQMVDTVGTTVYRYDNMNRMIESRDHNGYTVTYGFDKNGNRTNIVYGGGLQLGYSYDSAGRMIAASDWNGGTITYRYDPAGRMTNMLYPNGVQAVYAHDAAGRIVEYQYTHGTSLIHRTIERNAVGFKQREDILAGLEPFPTAPIVSSRDHDAADRLSGWQEQQTPDGSITHTNGFVFDENGNLVQRTLKGTTNTYTWTHDNLLSGIGNPVSGITYTYDGGGDRTSRAVDGITNRFLLDRAASLHNVLVETDTNGVPQRYYLFGARGLYAQIESDGSTFYIHADELGSTLALTDAAGNPVRQYAYSPYGEIINQTGVIDTPYTYIGAYGVYREAAHTGLYHMKARYYDARLKRFLSKDPIGLEGGVNFYLYANGNPVFHIDRYGLCAEQSLSERVLDITVDFIKRQYKYESIYWRRVFEGSYAGGGIGVGLKKTIGPIYIEGSKAEVIGYVVRPQGIVNEYVVENKISVGHKKAALNYDIEDNQLSVSYGNLDSSLSISAGAIIPLPPTYDKSLALNIQINLPEIFNLKFEGINQ